MANERWLYTRETGPFVSSGSMGSGSNDSWQIASRFPLSELRQGAARRFSILFQGQISNAQFIGTFTPGVAPAGVIEVALGLSTGMKSTVHRVQFSINEARTLYPGLPGVPYSFMMTQSLSPTNTIDPSFGATINTTSGADLCVWVRGFWNGDSPTYLTKFTTANNNWMIFDVDHLEADSRIDTTVRTDRTVPIGGSLPYTLIGWTGRTIGTANQKWLQVGHVSYKPANTPLFGAGVPLFSAPTFQFGTNSSSYAEVTGVNHTLISKCGMSGIQDPAVMNSPIADDLRVSQCSIGVIENDSLGAGDQPQVIALTPANTVFQGYSNDLLVKRTTLLHIRVDDLPAFAYNAVVSNVEADAVGNLLAPAAVTPTRFPMETPATTTFTTEPVIIGACDVSPIGGREQVIRLLNSSGGVRNEHRFNQRLLGSECQQTMIITPSFQRIGHSQQYSIDMQNRLIGFQITSQDAYFPFLMQFHPVLNVSDVGDPLYVEPTPTQLSLTTEGAAVGSMNALPIQPDMSQQVGIEGIKYADIRGMQGYIRAWPTMIRPRRAYTLQWSALSAADAATIIAFLDANDSFSYTPPRGTATPVSIVDDVQSYRFPDGRQTVSTRVIQLLYTS